ncbi:MAG: menaquinone reductase molybdopterin-binding-like subunit QrcB [Desulfobacteraceae bacterium]
MKIDRRSFLGLGLGAAAGVAASPVTWKLTDDISIWTQNWSWTPVPKDGRVTFDNTVCSLCSGNCGISVRKIAGRPVKIEGEQDHPVNKGGACLHGISGLQYLYDPSRIKAPMVKKNEQWEEVSWDEALNTVYEKLCEIRKDGDSHKLACIAKNDRGTTAGLFKRFLTAYGSSNFLTMESMADTWKIVASGMHGKNSDVGFDLENSDCILSFGCGFIEGWGSPVHNFRVNASRKERGAKLFQVEPRLSRTAANADMWIPAKPGTEADLALGICSVMVSRKWYNGEFVARLGKGFEPFAKAVTSDYTPARVAETTGIEAAKITAMAKSFARSKTGVAIAGKGRGESAGSLREFAAVHALNCLKGNINKKGGVWTLAFREYTGWPAVDMDAAAEKRFKKPRIDEAGSSKFPHTDSCLSNFVARVNKASTAPIRALFVHDANPCYAMADPAAVKEAFKKIPFVVSFSPYMDETAREADLILPSHTFLEKTEDLQESSMVVRRVTSLAKPVVDPLFNTKNPGDVIIKMAKAIGGSVGNSFPWKSYDQCLENVTGDMWDTLSDEGYVVEKTISSTPLAHADFSFQPLFAQGNGAEGDDSFPITLVPVDNFRLAAGNTQLSPFALKTVSDTVLKNNDGFVEIHPETAGKFKLAQGDFARVETPRGEAKVKVHLSETIMPGVAAMAAGLGHTGNNRYVDGKGVNVNELMGPVQDAGSGLDAAFGIMAKISRA